MNTPIQQEERTELNIAALDELRIMRLEMTKIFARYHAFGVALERMMVVIDRKMERLEKEITGEKELPTKPKRKKRTGFKASHDENLPDDAS